MERKTLTKSLHTVTAVSNVALMYYEEFGGTPTELVKKALRTLGQPGPWPKDDPTVLACIAATKRKIV